MAEQQFFTTWDVDIEDATKDKIPLLQSLKQKFQEQPADINICWRMVKACLTVSNSFEKVKNAKETKKYIEESFEYAKKAVEIGPETFEAHQWYCASVGKLSSQVGTKERIKYGHEFKEHRDIAVRLNPDDDLMHHMYGRWCFEVAGLTYIERKLAETFIASPPTSTYDEALESLLRADALKHEWKANHYWIAKTYIAKKLYPDAIKWVDSGLAFPIKTEEDAVTQIQLTDLEKSYAKYRK